MRSSRDISKLVSVNVCSDVLSGIFHYLLHVPRLSTRIQSGHHMKVENQGEMKSLRNWRNAHLGGAADSVYSVVYSTIDYRSGPSRCPRPRRPPPHPRRLGDGTDSQSFPQIGKKQTVYGNSVLRCSGPAIQNNRKTKCESCAL